MNNDVFSHEWVYLPTIFTSIAVTSENYCRWPKTSLFTATHILFNFLHAFLSLTHKEIDDNTHQSIAAPLLFKVGELVVELWRLAKTYCDVILTDCSYLSIVKSGSWRFHRLACKTVWLLCYQAWVIFQLSWPSLGVNSQDSLLY